MTVPRHRAAGLAALASMLACLGACTAIHPPLRFDWFVVERPRPGLTATGIDDKACGDTTGPAMYIYFEHFADDDHDTDIRDARVLLNAPRQDNWVERELNLTTPPPAAGAWELEGGIAHLLANTVYIWPAGCFYRQERDAGNQPLQDGDGQPVKTPFWASDAALPAGTRAGGCRVAVNLDVLYTRGGKAVSLHAEMPRELPNYESVELMSQRCAPPTRIESAAWASTDASAARAARAVRAEQAAASEAKP